MILLAETGEQVPSLISDRQKEKEFGKLMAREEDMGKLIEVEEKKTELDGVKEELERTKAKLRNDIALTAATEERLRKKDEELHSLKSESKETLKRLTEELDHAKKELRDTQLEFECIKADLRAKELLNKTAVEIARKDIQLQHASQATTEKERLSKELMSESIKRVEAEKRVEFLTKECAELRRKYEEGGNDINIILQITFCWLGIASKLCVLWFMQVMCDFVCLCVHIIVVCSVTDQGHPSPQKP